MTIKYWLLGIPGNIEELIAKARKTGREYIRAETYQRVIKAIDEASDREYKRFMFVMDAVVGTNRIPIAEVEAGRDLIRFGEEDRVRAREELNKKAKILLEEITLAGFKIERVDRTVGS